MQLRCTSDASLVQRRAARRCAREVGMRLLVRELQALMAGTHAHVWMMHGHANSCGEEPFILGRDAVPVLCRCCGSGTGLRRLARDMAYRVDAEAGRWIRWLQAPRISLVGQPTRHAASCSPQGASRSQIHIVTVRLLRYIGAGERRTRRIVQCRVTLSA